MCYMPNRLRHWAIGRAMFLVPAGFLGIGSPASTWRSDWRAKNTSITSNTTAILRRLGTTSNAPRLPALSSVVRLLISGGRLIKGDSDRRMTAAREWDLVARVRAIEGLADFLRPPAARRLISAAGEGTVAVVNVDEYRCDALLVTSRGVRACALPGLTRDDSVRQLELYLRSLQHLDGAVQKSVDARGRAQAQPSHGNSVAAYRAGLDLQAAESAADSLLIGIHEWLWDAVAEPVLRSAGLDEGPARGTIWPRLWWCPTGPLTLLPLHSAGYRGDPARSVLDVCASSYTPTVQALSDTRTGPRAVPLVSREAMLVRAPGMEEPSTTSRRDHFGSRGTGSAAHTTLSGHDATRASVLRELQRHRVVHFDCHGEQDLDDPSGGGLILADGRLTIGEIAAHSFRGDYAGLAACKTAVGGVDLLDEAISLTAALHYTGYRHVVGSLWSIRDDVAEQGFSRLYELMYNDHGLIDAERCPLALHTVVRGLRETYEDSPRLWAPLIHVGP